MPEKITNEQRLQLALLHSRVETAEGKLEAAKMAFAGYFKDVAAEYKMDLAHDSIAIDTGEITRRKPAEPPAPPASSV